MDNTNVFVIMFMYVLLMSPAWLEAFVIDPLFWRKLKDDKPISTYINIITNTFVLSITFVLLSYLPKAFPTTALLSLPKLPFCCPYTISFFRHI